MLEDARERVKKALAGDGEVIFTSGASEAAALALGHAEAGARLVGAVGHDCILQAHRGRSRCPSCSNGAVVHFENLAEAVRDGNRPLVAVQHVNSETGNRRDLARHRRDHSMARAVLLLARLRAKCGREFDLPPCDMAIVSAHKFGGPIGSEGCCW